MPEQTDPRVTLDLDRDAHIARITIRRREASNAIDAAMAAAICAHLDIVENDDDIKAVVISGEGNHLSTGWDVHEAWQQYRDAPGGSVRKHPSQRARLIALDENWWGPKGIYSRLLHCRKVTIVQAQGDCFETGLYLALCADLVVAAEDARFACPRWQNVGVDGDMSLLIAAVGLKRAKDLMFGGGVWSAREALGFGLIDWVGSAEGMLKKSDQLASMCASIMRDGIVSEKYAVFASLEKMGVGLSFAATTVVGASLSNIAFQPGEYNFLRELREQGAEAALVSSRQSLGS